MPKGRKDDTHEVKRPSHYVGVFGMEVEEVLRNFLPKYGDGYMAHRVGSAIEYLLRAPEKNGRQDIEKAQRNLYMLLEYLDYGEEDV